MNSLWRQLGTRRVLLVSRSFLLVLDENELRPRSGFVDGKVQLWYRCGRTVCACETLTDTWGVWGVLKAQHWTVGSCVSKGCQEEIWWGVLIKNCQTGAKDGAAQLTHKCCWVNQCEKAEGAQVSDKMDLSTLHWPVSGQLMPINRKWTV